MQGGRRDIEHEVDSKSAPFAKTAKGAAPTFFLAATYWPPAHPSSFRVNLEVSQGRGHLEKLIETWK